jgi:hypothetical protein
VRLDLTITGLAKALLDSQIEQEQSTQEIATRLLSHWPRCEHIVPAVCSGGVRQPGFVTPEALLRILRERKGGTDALGDSGDHWNGGWNGSFLEPSNGDGDSGYGVDYRRPNKVLIKKRKRETKICRD